MSAIAENLDRVRDRIANACAGCGRDPAEVTLVAVSKRIDMSLVLDAYRAGQRDFGENRIVDALQRQHDLTALLAESAPGTGIPRWHFIGHLQGNKARKAFGAFSLIHALDSESLARRIAGLRSEFDALQPVLVEVNTSFEAQKNGLPLDGAVERITALAEILGPSLEGLMTMARYGADEAELHQSFAALRRVAEEARRSTGLALPQLSMGMSADYPIAISEGATIVRVGTAIFGRRQD